MTLEGIILNNGDYSSKLLIAANGSARVKCHIEKCVHLSCKAKKKKKNVAKLLLTEKSLMLFLV